VEFRIEFLDEGTGSAGFGEIAEAITPPRDSRASRQGIDSALQRLGLDDVACSPGIVSLAAEGVGDFDEVEVFHFGSLFEMMSMNVPTMKFKVPQEHLELGVVVEQGFAVGVGDVNGEDAVVVVGLDKASVIAQESEFLVEFELMTDYGFEMGHDVSPLFEVPVREQDTSSFEITTTPGQYKGACA
jgi:hypothetical protein